MLIAISLGAFLATALGGLFALRFKDKLHLILGFSAGAVIAVAFFDLMPEALTLGNAGSMMENSATVSHTLALVALGFFGFMILDRFVFFHGCHSEGHTHDHAHTDEHVHEKENTRGALSAGSLSIHSFLDGIAVGLAFHVGISTGVVVAAAVLAHDFSDGINTVNLILKNGGTKKNALKWLLTDAIAPVIGIIATFFFTLPDSALALILAVFAGFFLYIGASDLLPESHHNHPTVWTTIATLLGAGVLYGVISIAGA